MSDWKTVLLVVGVPTLALVAYMAYLRFSDKKEFSKKMTIFKESLQDYFSRKQQLEEQAAEEKEAIPESKPFSLEEVDKLIERSKK